MDPTINSVVLKHPHKNLETEPSYFELPANLKTQKVNYTDFPVIEWEKKKEKHSSKITRKAAYPFEDLGNSIFVDHDAVILANIDSVYKLTKTLSDDMYGSVTVPSYPGEYVFMVFGIPDGYVQYLMWRRTDAVGHGVGSYNLDYLDYNRFSYKPKLSTGWTLKPQLVICEMKDVSDAVSRIKEGGHLIIRTYDTRSDFALKQMWILSHLFEKLSIIKPLSSFWGNNEKFIILKFFKENNEWTSAILKNVDVEYTFAFTTFVNSANDQITALISYYNTMEKQDIDEKMRTILNTVNPYDINKCFKVWNIPANPFQFHKKNAFFQNLIELQKNTSPEKWSSFIVDKLKSKQPNVLIPPYSDYQAELSILSTDDSNITVEEYKTIAKVNAWSNDLFLPKRMYNELQILQPNKEYIAELIMSWNIIPLNPHDKDLSFVNNLSDTKYEIKKDLLAFPTSTVSSCFYGLYDIDRMFGSKGSFFDIEQITGVCFMNLCQFDKKYQQVFVDILLEKIKKSEEPFLLFLVTDINVSSFHVLFKLKPQIITMSKHYAPDIQFDIMNYLDD